MPLYSNNILCVTIPELEKIGLSAGYLKRAIAGQRIGQVYCWEHHKIGRQIYIHHNSLLPKYKELIKNVLCNKTEPELWLKAQDEIKNNSVLKAIENQLPGLVKIDSIELKTLMETKLYSPTQAHQLARAAAWLRLLNEYDVKRVRSIGYKSSDEFRELVFKHILNEQIAHESQALIRWKKNVPITNLRVLLLNAVEYKKYGIQCMIHKGFGNVNREKADAQVHAKLIQLASERVKYSFEDIALMYNDWADESGKPNMTTSAIKAYLNIPKVKRVWYYARHGRLAADLEMQPIIQRDAPSFPDALWSLDGTTTQLYYKDDKGKMQSDLYAYFVTDAHTGAIIGHAIAFAETSELVTEALKNALDTYNNKPYQLQYDNSSANTSAAVRGMMSNMSRVHFPCEPYKGQGKYVEGIIGHFQQRVLRKMENFKGGNVDVKKLNSKANPELLSELKANPERLPSFQQVIDDFRTAIEEWNNRGEKRDSFGRWVGESKITRYTTIQHEKRVKLNYFDRMSLFVMDYKEARKYTTNGITIELNKNKYTYIVPDHDGIGDFAFMNEHLGEKFEIRLDVSKPQMITLLQKGIVVAYAYEKERYASCVADMKPGDGAKRIAFTEKRKAFGMDYSISELERQILILDTLAPTGTYGLGWWDTDKTIENTRNNAMEDKRNGVEENWTEQERKIFNIGR
ncbi:MAG: transposase family protein [Paludibacter sp.]|nr:transposase family protein [Paludibacter sp.]